MQLAHRNLQRVFQDAFSTADLARPLRSFDGDAAALAVRTVLDWNGEEVAGIRNHGFVEGMHSRSIWPTAGAAISSGRSTNRSSWAIPCPSLSWSFGSATGRPCSFQPSAKSAVASAVQTF